jgi:hypothetical protein
MLGVASSVKMTSVPEAKAGATKNMNGTSLVIG